MNNIRKNASMFLILFMLVVGMSGFSSVEVFADDTGVNSIEDVNVSFDEDGKLDMGLGFDEKNGNTDVWNRIFKKYKTVIVGFTGIAMLTSIIVFIVKFMQLQAASGNPTAKAQALQGLLWTGLATAGIGSVTVIVGFFYYAL